MPCYPACTPEPIIYQWTIQIYWLNDIVRTVYILVAYHLDGNGLLLVLINEDRRYILIDIFGQYGLDHHQVLAAICSFHHTQIIHVAIAIQVQV